MSDDFNNANKRITHVTENINSSCDTLQNDENDQQTEYDNIDSQLTPPIETIDVSHDNDIAADIIDEHDINDEDDIRSTPVIKNIRVHHKKNKPEEIISEKTIDTGREITKVIKTLDTHPELEESDYDYGGFPIELNAYITFFDQQGNQLQVAPPEIDDLKDYSEKRFVEAFDERFSPKRHGDDLVVWDEGVDRIIRKKDISKFISEKYYIEISTEKDLNLLKKYAKLIAARIHASYPTYFFNGENYVLFGNSHFKLDSDVSDTNPGNYTIYMNQNKMDEFRCRYRINANAGLSIKKRWLSGPRMTDLFFSTIANGNPVIIERIWQMIGYLITPDVKARSLFLLQGVPSSGKSVLGKLISNLFYRENVSHFAMNQLGKSDTTTLLTNKCINIHMDLPNTAIPSAAISTLKILTGNDETSYNYFGRDRHEMFGHCKFLFATNHPLVIRGEDAAFCSRIICIPFTNSIPREQQDFNYINYLLMEKDYIVTRALESYRRLVSNNYIFAGSGSYECNSKYITSGFATDEMNPSVANFVVNRCEFGEYRIHTIELYNAYLWYCNSQRIKPINSIKSFSRQFKTQYEFYVEGGRWRDDRDNHLHGFVGITLKEYVNIDQYKSGPIYNTPNKFQTTTFDNIIPKATIDL